MSLPNLSQNNHSITSPETPDYNCIAWAAGESDRWWWPNPAGHYFWPAGIAREETPESFRLAFESIGFEQCGGGDLEQGCEKVVLYCNQNVPTHMARQLPNGEWTSKLGQSFDISHQAPETVAGGIYGQVVMFFRKRSTNPAPCDSRAIVMDGTAERPLFHATGSTIRQGSNAS